MFYVGKNISYPVLDNVWLAGYFSSHFSVGSVGKLMKTKLCGKVSCAESLKVEVRKKRIMLILGLKVWQGW